MALDPGKHYMVGGRMVSGADLNTQVSLGNAVITSLERKAEVGVADLEKEFRMGENQCCVRNVIYEAIPQIGCAECVAWPRGSCMCRSMPPCGSSERGGSGSIIWRPAGRYLPKNEETRKEEIMGETTKKEMKPSGYSATIQIHEGPVVMTVSEGVNLSIQTTRPPIITVDGQEITIQG